MPTFDRAPFIGRAIESLCAQQYASWELTVVDDGSTDATASLVERLRAREPRIHYVRLDENQGLGAALNAGLAVTRAPLVAYLPSDDVYYPEHLASLVAVLVAEPSAVLARAGVRHHYNRSALSGIADGWLQLVQVMHRRTADRWTVRERLVTDDLDRMFWTALRQRGSEVSTGRVTCEWVDHPDQRHKVLREPEGGINRYRQRYRVRRPIRFHSSCGNCIDEPARYRAFRERPDTPRAADGLRILLAGELAYNAERVLALEERGHELHGAWMPEPFWYNTVGPVPFGHVHDLPADDWEAAMARLQPDIVYGLLNWQAVPFCRRVRRAAERLGIPFVWHFKEGPFICLEKGTWPLLAELYERADGIIHTSEEMRDWFDQVFPARNRATPSLVLDGDLPKREWFDGPMSAGPVRDGRDVHTVVPGRPIGLHPSTLVQLAGEGVHLHFYGDFTHGQWQGWIEKTLALAPHHLHLHPQVDQEGWVREFSAYDAGWLHIFESGNEGDLRRATWDDLNLPARMATYAAAGLPMIQRSNPASRVAAERLTRSLGVGVFFSEVEELSARLRDRSALQALRANVMRHRHTFTFDAHADRLIAFFRTVIDR